MVFDILRFIQQNGGKGVPVIALIISAQIIIAGDDDIISVQLSDFLLALRIGSLYAKGTQINGKFLNLILPVVNQRGEQMTMEQGRS